MLIRTKLIIGFLVLLVFFIVSAYSSWHSMQTHDENSKQIQHFGEGTAHILESNIALRRFVASQNEADAKAVLAAMDKAVRATRQAMAYDMEQQQTRRAERILQQIAELQVIFTRQEQEIRTMKETVATAIDASGKAFTAISQIVAANISNLRTEALPRRIEAASLLDDAKGLFLLGRNQFTTLLSG